MDPRTSMRRFLKINNHHLWRDIKYLILHNNLDVLLHKVKAHSGDLYNDLADAEAKKGLTLPPLHINPKSIHAIMTPLWVPWVRLIGTLESSRVTLVKKVLSIILHKTKISSTHF